MTVVVVYNTSGVNQPVKNPGAITTLFRGDHDRFLILKHDLEPLRSKVVEIREHPKTQLNEFGRE